MSKELGAAIVQASKRSLSMAPCRVMQVTPLLVSFDGGTSSVSGRKIAGLTYSTSSTNNAVALLNAGEVVVLPLA